MHARLRLLFLVGGRGVVLVEVEARRRRLREGRARGGGHLPLFNKGEGARRLGGTTTITTAEGVEEVEGEVVEDVVEGV